METPTEQCNPLESVGPEQVQFAINYTLAYLEWAERRDAKAVPTKIDTIGPVERLVRHYRCGTLGTGLQEVKIGQMR